ncbi:hypothetical protein P2C08_18695 [Xanthomonas perforans]|uniref:GRAM domain-containing protein n=1 Tax=Xanthomonas euvesicatoria TaxID=456327 RepID=A0AAX4FPM7_XANEU|nr:MULTISPECIES: hypothetical protein [Xanthomonas]AEO43648.1 hypothetical protein XACM_3401 [Xanthomonas euvesicatoria pv. citrumelo F1]MBO9793733.1 hypothetical protein [Xanthomonas phaseoli pv. dieffenbachiae]MBO9857075.1 hypothetical protein [Xanthomonas sp. A1809]MBV6670458.1 hypothetical protein [Xanthomonas euvesicatoria pv. alangii]MBV6788007.1 hypothetical protein [Xanthomonas campestris pv. clerodendri]
MRSIDRAVLRQAPANLQRGMEAVGGRLILTADALLFQPHAFNVQRQTLSLPLPQIVAIQSCWTRLFGLLPIAPTSLAVRLEDGKRYRFVIGKRTQWMADIASARDALR